MVMRSDFNKFRTKVDNLNVKFYDTGIIMKNIEQRLAHMEKNILTKEYLDLKIKEFLANLDQLIGVDNP
jgi:ribonuclease HIII